VRFFKNIINDSRLSVGGSEPTAIDSGGCMSYEQLERPAVFAPAPNHATSNNAMTNNVAVLDSNLKSETLPRRTEATEQSDQVSRNTTTVPVPISLERTRNQDVNNTVVDVLSPLRKTEKPAVVSRELPTDRSHVAPWQGQEVSTSKSQEKEALIPQLGGATKTTALNSLENHPIPQVSNQLGSSDGAEKPFATGIITPGESRTDSNRLINQVTSTDKPFLKNTVSDSRSPISESTPLSGNRLPVSKPLSRSVAAAPADSPKDAAQSAIQSNPGNACGINDAKSDPTSAYHPQTHAGEVTGKEQISNNTSITEPTDLNRNTSSAAEAIINDLALNATTVTSSLPANTERMTAGSTPAAVSRAPQVQIGQVNVIIEAPAAPPPQSPSIQAEDLSSRLFLRSL